MVVGGPETLMFVFFIFFLTINSALLTALQSSSDQYHRGETVVGDETGTIRKLKRPQHKINNWDKVGRVVLLNQTNTLETRDMCVCVCVRVHVCVCVF